MDTNLKLLVLPVFAFTFIGCHKTPSPNVIVIITDDQGYGDLSYTGNPHLKTPVIDKLAEAGIRFTNFYVCPVSAPTRSALMTGRYSLRTGVHDTYNGGAIMASNEITIAEMLKAKGYRTGIFGKWHLGDNYPCRPCDQGFDESVIHLGGGMGQPMRNARVDRVSYSFGGRSMCWNQNSLTPYRNRGLVVAIYHWRQELIRGDTISINQ